MTVDSLVVPVTTNALLDTVSFGAGLMPPAAVDSFFVTFFESTFGFVFIGFTLRGALLDSSFLLRIGLLIPTLVVASCKTFSSFFLAPRDTLVVPLWAAEVDNDLLQLSCMVILACLLVAFFSIGMAQIEVVLS